MAAGFKKIIMDSKNICGSVRQRDNFHKYFIKRFIENIVDQCNVEIAAKYFCKKSE
jgi:hypothetical protein